MKKISIIGLGYVGLPLSLQFAKNEVFVLGVDVDEKKAVELNKGNSFIKHIKSEEISVAIKSGKFHATTDFSKISETDAVLICVPTPIGKHNDPNLSYVLETAKSIAPYIQKGMLIALESTTYPGTTDEELRKVLESGSGMTAGEDFYVAYSPEREDPGNPVSKVAKIPKVVGGYTPACLEKALELYSLAIENLVPVSSCRAAEATKLLENIFRSVNIALVNELKQIYDAMDIDIWEVINAAATKPFGYMPFYPGPGLGGHCIPIDPFYLTWKAKEFGKFTRFIELAGEINTAMPDYVIEKLNWALNMKKKAVNGSKVLLVGLAYKSNVDDDRESPGYVIMDMIKERGGHIDYYDPYIPVIRPSREYSHWAGKESVQWDEDVLKKYDAIIITTEHKNVDHQILMNIDVSIIDTRNSLAGFTEGVATVTKA